jgi:hypothetical protein
MGWSGEMSCLQLQGPEQPREARVISAVMLVPELEKIAHNRRSRTALRPPLHCVLSTLPQLCVHCL